MPCTLVEELVKHIVTDLLPALMPYQYTLQLLKSCGTDNHGIKQSEKQCTEAFWIQHHRWRN